MLSPQPLGGATKRPLSFVPGVNTDPDISRAQIKINAARDLPWLEVCPAHGRSLAIVAGGPSLKARVDELRYFSGDVLALNNAYGFLLDHGITPDLFMLMDARRENVDFLKRTGRWTRHYIAAQCHPDIFDHLDGQYVCLYLTTLPGIKELLVEYQRPKVQLGGTAGTVGIKALSLAFALGYRDIHLYGYDSSYEDGQHHAFPQPLNDAAKTIEVFIGDKGYMTTPALAHQATEFVGFAKELVMFQQMQIELHCSGLLPDLIAAANTAGEIPLEQREQEKYEEIWSHHQYRREAPGLRFVSDAMKSLGIKEGDSLIDYGAGTGRASFAFSEYEGLDVTAVDFVPTAFEYATGDGYIRFVKACLWELPESLTPSDWAYCFPAGTPVLGSGKTIDNIRVGDTVWDRQGKPQKVLKTFVHDHSGEMVSLKVDCLAPIDMTDEHPVLVSSLRRVHRVAARTGVRSEYEWVANEPKWKAAKDIAIGDWIQVPRRDYREQVNLQFKKHGNGIAMHEFCVEEGAAWLLGLYVAEGSISKSKPGAITLSLGSHETVIANRAVAEFARIGVTASLQQPPSVRAMNGLRVFAKSVGLAAVLEDWCGRGAVNKRIPPVLYGADDAIVRSFLSGLVAGDGCLRRDPQTESNYFSVATISRVLATDVVTLLVSMGIHCRWSEHAGGRESAINGRTLVASDIHCISWQERAWEGTADILGRTPYGRMKFVGKNAYARVAEVGRYKVSNLPVFNIHTEDETYGVPFTVHNCTDVMEHIPIEKVELVIAGIAARAIKGAYFNISTRSDNFGALIGRKLHMTVMQGSGWHTFLSKYFAHVEMIEREDEATFICKR